MSFQLLKKNGEYRNLYFAGLSSEMGSFISETTLMLFIYHITDNNKAYMGASRSIFLIFFLLGSLSGGPIGDRLDRRKVLMACEWFRMPIIAAMFIWQGPIFLMIAHGLVAFFTGIFQPTRQALLNDLVDEKNIDLANGLFSSTFAFIHMLGPFIGATIFAQFKGINEVLALDLFTYVIGLIFIVKIKYQVPSFIKEKATTHPIQEFKDGLIYVKNRPDILAIFYNSITLGLVIGILLPLLIPYTKEVLNVSAHYYGHQMAIFGIGGILGGVFGPKLIRKFHSGKIIIITFVLESLMLLIWLAWANLYYSMAALFFWGIVVFIRIAVQLNYFSLTINKGNLAKCHALANLAFVTPNIVGGTILIFLGKDANTFHILLAAGLAFLFLNLIRLNTKKMRSLWDYPLKNSTT